MVTTTMPSESNSPVQESARDTLEQLRARKQELRVTVNRELRANVTQMTGPFSSMRQTPMFSEQIVDQFLDLLGGKLTEAEMASRLRFWVQRGLGPEGAYAVMDVLYRAAADYGDASLAPALDNYRRQFTVGFEVGRRTEILREHELMQRSLQVALEKQIASEREARAALQRRQTQLQLAADLARTTTSTRDLNELMALAVRQLQDGFGLDFVGIFLLDEFGQWAILRGGAGTLGEHLVANGYQVRIDRDSPFDVALSTRQMVALENSVWQDRSFVQPLQPATASSLIAPLLAHGQIVGFLTLHSAAPARFSEQDFPILMVIADNLANAIENAELFSRAQANLQELERAQRGYVREMWATQELGSEVVYSQKQDAFAGSAQQAPASAAPGKNGNAAQAALSVPITLRGEVIGTVDLFDTTQPRDWSEEEKALAASVVEQMALAVENARLFDEAQQRAHEMTAINEITNVISQELELDRLLADVHGQVQRVLPADAFFVSLYDDLTDMVSYPFVFDDGKRYDNSSTSEAPMGSLSQVIRSKESILINRTPQEIEYARARLSQVTGLGDTSRVSASLVYAPLRLGDRIVGVISAQSYTPNAYKERDVELLEGIGIHVAVALQNARLFETTQKRAQETAIINDMARALSGELDQEKLFATVYAYLPRLMPTDAFVVWFYDEESKMMTRPFLYDVGVKFPPDMTARPLTARLHEVSETNRPLYANLTREEWEAERAKTDALFGSSDPSASLLYVPLRYGESVRGFMSAQSYRFNAYSEHEAALLTSVANHLATALENAELFAETNQALAETQLLYSTGEQLNQVGSPEELVRIAAKPAFEQGAGSAQLLLIDYQGQENPVAADVVVSLVAPGDRAPLSPYTHFPIHQFALGQAMLANPRELVLIENVQSSPMLDHATRSVLLASNDQAVILLPLSVEQRVLGAIAIGWAEPHAFSPQERRIYQALAAQLALVLNNRLLFEQTQEALAEAQTLYEISARLNTAGSVQEALEAASGPAIVQGAHTTALMRVSTDESNAPSELEFVAVWPRNTELAVPLGTRFPSDYLVGAEEWLASPQEPRLYGDIMNDPRVTDLIRAALQAADTRAVAILPLRIAERWVGLLVFSWHQPRTFSQREARMFRTVMAQASTVLDNRALFEQTETALAQTQVALRQVQEAQDRLSLQYQTANILARAASFDHAAVPLLENTCRSLDWQMGEYWTVDEAHNRLVLTHLWTQDDAVLHDFASDSYGLSFGRGEGLAGQTWADARPIWIPNIYADNVFRQVDKAAQSGLKSALAFPLQSETRQFGVMVFFSTQEQGMDDTLLATMVGVGSQVGQFMERRRAEEAMRQQNTYLTALHDTTLGLMARLDLDELLQNIITRAGELIGTQHGYVHLIEPTGNELRMRVGIGIYSDFVGTRVRLGQGLAGTVWQQKQPIVVDDYRNWQGRLQMVDRDVLRAVAGVPLKSGNQTVGVLGLASLDENYKFGAAQVEALGRFAELAAVALDNAQLYTASQEALDQSRRLAQREKASSEIADKLYAASDVKAVLRTAAEELQRSTGSRRAVVRLNVPGLQEKPAAPHADGETKTNGSHSETVENKTII